MRKALLLSLALLATTSAHAAGYQLQEYSVTGLGRAFAGAGVMGDDYSAIAFNPAGMSLVNKSGIQMGAIATDVRGKVWGESQPAIGGQGQGFLGTKSGKTGSRIFRVMPNFFGQYKINDRTDVGLGLYVPFGLANDYNNTWFGAEHGQYSGITVVNLTPTVSYKILDSVSMGLGVNLQYAEAHLTGAVPGNGSTNMRDANDVGVGYTWGLTYKPTKTTRFGLSYRSKVTHKLEGKNDGSASRSSIFGGAFAVGTAFLNGTHKVHAKITTPETVIFSAAHDLNDKWTLSGIARWTRWSQFKRLNIYQENKGLLSSTHENWKNTWLFGLGADYKYCKNLTFRFGTAWDTAAVKAPEYRTARIPDQRRIWASLGASYMKDNWQVDVGYSHIFVHKAQAYGSNVGAGYFHGKYRIESDIFGLGLQYKF